jgi:hypothetical protein
MDRFGKGVSRKVFFSEEKNQKTFNFCAFGRVGMWVGTGLAVEN